MQNYTEDAFLDRVMQSVVDEHEADPDDPTLRSACQQLVQHARTWGFSTELEVATYAVCGFLLGAEFRGPDGLPFRVLLMNREMVPVEKGDKMLDLLQDYQDSLDKPEIEAVEHE